MPPFSAAFCALTARCLPACLERGILPWGMPHLPCSHRRRALRAAATSDSEPNAHIAACGAAALSLAARMHVVALERAPLAPPAGCAAACRAPRRGLEAAACRLDGAGHPPVLPAGSGRLRIGPCLAGLESGAPVPACGIGAASLAAGMRAGAPEEGAVAGDSRQSANGEFPKV